MKRTEIISALIGRYNYERYLEIGVQGGENFKAIDCAYKVGVDPDPASAATMVTTSDDFFADNTEKWDLIFIDGLHHAIQVYKDIVNALQCLADGGTIVCHDMNPTDIKMQQVPRIQQSWNGDCWMAWVWLRATRPDIEMMVLDTDHGCGIITKGRQELLQIDCNITFENFKQNKKRWLNLKTVYEAGFKPMEQQPVFSESANTNRIYFNQVFERSGNIGLHYNKFMSLLPNDDDFACFTDNDAIFTTYGHGEQLHKIIEKYPECGLFVATANRIGCLWQRNGAWNNDNMKDMRAFGKRLADKHYDQVEDVTDKALSHPFSGFLILIRKSTWKTVGGFLEEGVLGVDNDLHRRAHEHGEKVYLMKGVFLYHWYRGGNRADKTHFSESKTAKAI